MRLGSNKIKSKWDAEENIREHWHFSGKNGSLYLVVDIKKEILKKENVDLFHGNKTLS